MYNIIEGIVKVINPQGKAILGIADGQGKFLWLPTEYIKGAFPPSPQKWQTTRFMIDSTYKIVWKAEKNWEQWKQSYNPQNIIPLPHPIPAEFAIEPTFQLQAAQIPTQPTVTQHYIPQVPNVYTQQSQPIKISPVVPEKYAIKQDSVEKAILDELRVIGGNIYKILQLFNIFMKPPKLVTADTLPTNMPYPQNVTVIDRTQEDVFEEYGVPPDEEFSEDDDLPEVF